MKQSFSIGNIYCVQFSLNLHVVRQKVLTHHPDKQTAEAQQSEGDDLFKCIKIGALYDMQCTYM